MIVGHKHLYFNGALHRDVSPGNILIEWHPGSEGDEPSTSGCLIDLDRGKRGKMTVGQVNASVDEGLDPVVLHWCSLKKVDAKVARQALELVPVKEDESGLAITYITAAVRHASNFRGLGKQQICTPYDLRWKPVWPFFRICSLS
jgi:Fungal protein kinase